MEQCLVAMLALKEAVQRVDLMVDSMVDDLACQLVEMMDKLENWMVEYLAAQTVLQMAD